jgi:hypothetical protein
MTKEETEGWRKLHSEDTSLLALLAKFCKSDQIKENEIGSACTTNGREERSIKQSENQKRRDHLADLDAVLKIILKSILKTQRV